MGPIDRTAISDPLMTPLQTALDRAGCPIWEQDGVWVSEHPEHAQAIIDNFKDNLLAEALPAAVARTKAAIDTQAAEARVAVRRASQPFATEEEMATWTAKAAQARAWQASQDDLAAPLIAGEVARSGEAMETAVARVIRNAEMLETAEAAISGIARGHKNAVATLAEQANSASPADVADLIAAIVSYDASTGWPA